ncbi:hypothetical protein [Oceanobacillus oncorhynchi]|uniref:hypothetical protein n=1 Tax=Oceanobacillus oncorhynchi TaxID=545501 RepID=UPI001866850E|nr:hypothetical protein [Oceanobacillus oncorhynchi]
MIKIDFEDFYHNSPIKKPIKVEKYYFNDGMLLDTRQMTYSFIDEDMTGMEPTFEVDDVIISERTEEVYVIVQTDRIISEVYAELLGGNMKKTGKCIWLEENEIYHKLKNVEWINRT